MYVYITAFWIFETTFFSCFIRSNSYTIDVIFNLTLFVAAGYWQVALTSSLAFLWERKRVTWGKVHEFYPWGWTPWCDNNRLVFTKSVDQLLEEALLRMKYHKVNSIEKAFCRLSSTWVVLRLTEIFNFMYSLLFINCFSW